MAKENDFNDYDVIIQRFWPNIVHSASGYEIRPALREELAQEMALEVWRGLPRFNNKSTLKTYIYRIIHNVGVDHIRRYSRASETMLDSELLDENSSLETALQYDQRQEQLALMLQRLPLSLRQVLMLKLEDLSNIEISDVLGLSESNVAVRLNRAKHKLSELMAGVDK
ncbi:RNA polymerase sigma factor [Kangiella shandongensis]|uniref:RNA polymerase sigma factor n=1 Tax=Kangiella shandongensis TaxID=2763258 RepID=UPI001CBAC02F|nr:sigma-70 family RNA polymerase sigma factor [Kangiella shandongensis]